MSKQNGFDTTKDIDSDHALKDSVGERNLQPLCYAIHTLLDGLDVRACSKSAPRLVQIVVMTAWITVAPPASYKCAFNFSQPALANPNKHSRSRHDAPIEKRITNFSPTNFSLPFS